MSEQDTRDEKPLLHARAKSPGRVAWAKHLNATGQRGVGGVYPTHGLAALEALLRKGLEPETPIGRLHTERRRAYLQDLGGAENCSNMEQGICDRLADLDLERALLNARRENAHRISVKMQLDHSAAVIRNVLAYIQAARVVGPGRRERVCDPFREEMLRQELEAEREERERHAAESNNGNGTDHAEG